MEEFLKSYFVQNKQLIFEELGIISLNIIPAYFDTQHQQLFPSYFNYTFSPAKTLKNDILFFDSIAKYLNISNQEAQQLFKNFTSNLISDFNKKSSFQIPYLAIVRHVNNAYLVEIDSNFQMVFNPIEVNQKKIKAKTYIIPAPIHVSLPQHHSPRPNKQSTIHIDQTPVTPKNIIVKEENKQSVVSSIYPKNTTQTEEKKKVKHSLSSQKKEEPIVATISHQTINRMMIYFFIAILLIVVFLIAIKFWIFNDTNFLSSLWK